MLGIWIFASALETVSQGGRGGKLGLGNLEEEFKGLKEDIFRLLFSSVCLNCDVF